MRAKMRGLKKGVDLSFFIGRELIQICVGQNEVILRFHKEDLWIRIQSEIVHEDSLKRRCSYNNYSIAALSIGNLLGHRITHVHGTEDGTLSLSFDNDEKLEILDTDPAFESYAISHDGVMISV
jgi:hypothetical protein